MKSGRRLPPVTWRRTGLRVAILLGAPVDWTAAFALRWRSTVVCAARARSMTVLSRALFVSDGGKKGVARLLRGQGAFLTALFADACDAGHADVARLLLALPPNRGVNPAALSNDALLWACRNGHTEIVELLLALPLSRGVNPAATETSALWWACWGGHVEIVRLLLALPA